MSIRNLKDGSDKPWMCECYPNGRRGKRVRKKFVTKGEAKAFELHVMRETNDKPWLGHKPDQRRLSEIIDLWYQLHGKNLKSGAFAKRRMELLCEDLGNPIAAHITTKQLAHYRANRTPKSKGQEAGVMSAASLNTDTTRLKAIFNTLAKLDEWSRPNPVNGISKIKTGESELTFLSEEQITHLLDTAEKSCLGENLANIFRLCLETGARINEAINLKGAQLSKYKVTYTNTKGKRNRSVPVRKELYERIYKPGAGRLFPTQYPGAYKVLIRALPNLPEGQATHVLRHTFATHYMIGGGNIIDLQNILGHQNIEQTMVYAHFSPTHLTEATKLNPIARMGL